MKKYLFLILIFPFISSCFLMPKYQILESYKNVITEKSLETEYSLNNTLDKLKENNDLINSLEGTWINEKFLEEIEKTGSLSQSIDNVREPNSFKIKPNNKLLKSINFNIGILPYGGRNYNIDLNELEKNGGKINLKYPTRNIENSNIHFISENKILITEKFKKTPKSYLFIRNSKETKSNIINTFLTKMFEYKNFKIKNTKYKNVSFNDDKSITGWNEFNRYELEEYPYHHLHLKHDLIVLIKGDKKKSFAVKQEGNTWYWYKLKVITGFSRVPDYEKGELAYTMIYKANGLLGMVEK